jgi:tRNA pseudouridine32 synthase/23S rRNA pseudouridine746 synthase
MKSTNSEARLASISTHLRIRVLHTDEYILVIEKPSNLRSVAGNISGSKRPHEEQMTAQQAWIAALGSFQPPYGTTNERDPADEIHRWVTNLALAPSSFASIPRKLKPFMRYCERNQGRLVPDGQPRVPPEDLQKLTPKMHALVEGHQRSLMNLPEATMHEDSAFGQLILMGYARSERPANIFAVHRLDCETSGVMVFARTQEAASILSKAWRERDRVSKSYVARVKSWPPFKTDNQTKGIIELSLAPSDERPKWKVDPNGKPSKTLWKVRLVADDAITLELTPVTGRTHQLRIHVAEIGSGIQGDTLYGDDIKAFDPNNPDSPRLCLHAETLSFPHPFTGETTHFTTDVPW